MTQTSTLSTQAADIAERVSNSVAALEKVAAGLLIALVAVLILLNVVTRYFNYALYWVDEAAIYAMVWATLVAASLCVRNRALISVTLLEDAVGPKTRRVMQLISDVIMLVFAGYCLWLSWIWFSPAEFARAGFDVGTFVMNTGNFIYGEPTNTIGIKKFWVWLIMPIFAVTLTIHSVANLLKRVAGEPHIGEPA